MALRRLLLLLLLLPPLACCVPACAGALRILVDTGTEMPIARFENAELVGGIQRDLGVALARALDRTPQFIALPRKRIGPALAAGGADVLCYYKPEWLAGPFGWSQPFLPLVEVVITDRKAERPRALSDLAGQTIGTVLGYMHPELEEILGKGFVRQDGPSTEANLRKLVIGRIRHVVTSEAALAYRLKLGDPVLSLYPPLVVRSHLTYCALSPLARIGVGELNAAIDRIVRDGSLAAIFANYQ